MQSILTPADIEDFYVRLYFKVKDGNFMMAAINRAYRDFSRTLRNLPASAEQRDLWKSTIVKDLMSELELCCRTTFSSQEEFDTWHEDACMKLVNTSSQTLTPGQAQKWVNMSLKYLYLLGESRISGISRNYRFFHIPIDNIIQKELYGKHQIAPLLIAWSQIPTYEMYARYQKTVAASLEGRIVMDVEFLLYNKS